LLEQLHETERTYAKIIESEFADFWTRVGPEEHPEIEDFRFSFSPSYFA
jgi:hypothetical protein